MAAISESSETLVQIRHVVKNYGSTRALTGVTLDVGAGQIMGIVGHNGAGKSTLMRLLTGIETCDAGMVQIGGVTKPDRAGFPGVRMAYQEGTLALELTVKENVYLSSSSWMPRWRWHGTAGQRATARLNEIFPGNCIRADDHVDDLTLAERQMVEIARATINDNLRLLILDEPTESLSGGAVDHLYEFVRKLRNSGCAIILVSHRLREILSVCDHVTVMKDGAVVSTRRAAEVSERDLFLAMGGDIVSTKTKSGASKRELVDKAPTVVRIPMTTIDDAPTDIIARKGEVVGLAGIAGQGQEKVLDRIWRGRRGDVEVGMKRAFVPGDRQRSGILPLWNVDRNLTISALGYLSKRGVRQINKEALLVENWVGRLNVKGGPHAAMTGLSGGNQQKVLVARAFASEADTILLDDPFRGVDVHTKAELYQLIRSEATKGKTIIWYSSENSEMQHCDRTYVLRANRVAGELHSTEISDERIIAMSFVEQTGAAN